MAERSDSGRERQNGAEPVYGPAYTGPRASAVEPATPEAMAGSASVAGQPRAFDGPSPPYTAPYPPYPSDVPDTLPIPANLAAALAYLVAPAVLFLLLPAYRSNSLLRFHSWQAIFYFLAAVAARQLEQLVVSMLPSAVAFTISGLLTLLIVAGGLVAVIKALQGEKWQLPLVGSYAERTSSTTSLRS